MKEKNRIIVIVLLLLSGIFPTVWSSVPRMVVIPHSGVESGFQDWTISQDSLLRIYVGNQEGLLRYDGERWQGYYLPNQSAIHALLCASDTVYVGGFDEFGFFCPERPGSYMVYRSLSDGLKGKFSNITEIKNICRCGDAIYFQSDYWLFEYQSGNVKGYHSPKKMTCMSKYGGELVLGAGDQGLLFFKKGVFSKYDPAMLTGKYIVNLLPYKGKLLIATANSGLYSINMNHEVDARNTPADFFLENGNISAMTVDGDNIAYASMSKGVCVVNIKTGKVEVYNVGNGLKSNTVYSVFFDARHDLWVGGEDGLTLIVLNSPISHISAASQKLGIGYSSAIWQGRYYLGTSQGLFYLDGNEVAIPESRLSNYQPPVMSITPIGEELFVCTNDGLHVMTPSGSHRIAGVPPAFDVKALHSDPNTLVVSTNDNFYLVKRVNGIWVNEGKISGYNDISGRFMIDQYDDIWINHWLKGVFRMGLSADKKRFARVNLYDSKHGFPDNAGNTMVNLKGDVAFSTRDGVYIFDRGRNRFVKGSQYAGSLPSNPSATLVMDSDGTVLSVSPDNIIVSKILDDNTLKVDSSSFKSILGDLLPGYVDMLAMGNGNMLLSTRHGFVKFDTEFVPKSSNRRMRLFVENVSTPDNKSLYQYTADKIDNLTLAYADNTLKFSVSLPEYRGEGSTLYSYRLEGYEKEWSQMAQQSVKEYTQLPEGNYTLHIKALNTIDGEIYEEQFKFRVLPPWYRSIPAKIIYTILIIVGIFLGYKWIKRYVAKKMRKAQEMEQAKLEALQREAEMQLLKDQYELERMSREQMEHNIKVKSEELSNTTMNVIRKNELLNNIMLKMKGVEDAVKENGYNGDVKKSFNNLQRLISDNIEHDDDWKKFTDNFDIVYNNFAKRLREQFPELTKSELRVCCYIKMGLSSKEISSIFNLSVRSIEMYRYQIRPKVGLTHGERLSTFLENF